MLWPGACLRLTLGCLLLGACSSIAAESSNLWELDFTEDRTFNVLLTGFLPFLNWTYNPSGEAVKQLTSVCEDVVAEVSSDRDAKLRICWHTHLLPVNHTGVMWPSEHLQSFEPNAPPYDAVIHVGFQNSSKGIKVEIAAANIKSNDTGTDGTQPAIVNSSDGLATTVNLGWMSMATGGGEAQATSHSVSDFWATPSTVLMSYRADAQKGSHDATSEDLEYWSRDPGKYYCNELYFRTLHFIRSRSLRTTAGSLLPALFVHVGRNSTVTIKEDVEAFRKLAAEMIWGSHIVRPRKVDHKKIRQDPPMVLSATEEASSFGGTSGFVTAMMAMLLAFSLGVVFGGSRTGHKGTASFAGTGSAASLLGDNGDA